MIERVNPRFYISWTGNMRCYITQMILLIWINFTVTYHVHYLYKYTLIQFCLLYIISCCVYQQGFGGCSPHRWSKSIINTAKSWNFFEIHWNFIEKKKNILFLAFESLLPNTGWWCPCICAFRQAFKDCSDTGVTAWKCLQNIAMTTRYWHQCPM